MIGYWLDLPAAGMFAVLIAVYGATAAAVALLAFGPGSAAFRRLDGVVPPYIGAIGILFALLTGFLAGDVGDRNRQAARAVQTETGELRNVFTLSVASASDMSKIRGAWAAYVKAVLEDDWPAMEHGEQSPRANAAYDALLREVSDPRIAAEAGNAVHAALLGATVRVGTARAERLALATDRTNTLKWTVVLILGVLTQAAIGLVHLQKRAPHIAALALFSAAAVIALGLIAMQEHPFAGEVRIAPTPLVDLVRLPGA